MKKYQDCYAHDEYGNTFDICMIYDGQIALNIYIVNIEPKLSLVSSFAKKGRVLSKSAANILGFIDQLKHLHITWLKIVTS